MRELLISQDVTAENYWHDLLDASLYGDGATLEQRCIPTQPKQYFADQRHYDAGLRNIPFPLEAENPIPNWRPEVENDVTSINDYGASFVCWNPKLMWFHIPRSEGFFATNAERLAMCLSDTYYWRKRTEFFENKRSLFPMAAILVKNINLMTKI